MGTSHGRIYLILLLLPLGVVFGQTSWFRNAYRDYADFIVMGRNLEEFVDQESRRRYVLLLTGQASVIENPVEVVLPDEELKAAVHRALQAQGFLPALAKEEAELAIVVAYGTGEYKPPFAFVGVDPAVVPFPFWPRALKEYDQAYHRRDYHDVELTQGVVERGAVSDAQRVNFIAIRAFDAGALRGEKRWVLRWETRVTTDALERPLTAFFPAMIVAATDRLGTNARTGTIKTARVREGVVDIGELESLGVVPPDAPARKEQTELLDPGLRSP